MSDAVSMAYEIIDLHKQNMALRREIKRLSEYESRYQELLRESIAHGEKTMVNWVDLLLSDAITINKVPATTEPGQ